MPFGPSSLGAIIFVVIAFAGYGYAGVRLNGVYRNIGTVAPWKFGAARTALGLVVGLAFAASMAYWGITHSMLLWYLLLVPIRFLEWLGTIWLFYERKAVLSDWRRVSKYSLAGSAWSSVLDIPAALSMIVVPGGMWIC
jgi:hypothetical protein